MRKLILSILLASVATAPAVAQRGDRSDREQTRAERQEAREQREEAREERQREQVREDRQSRPDTAVRDRRAERVEAIRRGHAEEQLPYNVRPEGRADRASIDQIRAARQNAQVDRQQTRQGRRDTLRQHRELRQAERARPPVLRGRVPVVSNSPRAGTQPPPRVEQRRYAPIRWSGDWRRNSRYDWYSYRNRNRSLFRLGFYMDPFGWGYQPYSIGWRMWPSYYRSSFWLNDPWQYRLPYAPPGTRWIRYYNDAILVDTWDGQVVDVLYNFFW